MDFARSRPDTGIGDRGSGVALLSVPAGTAVRMDCHGNQPRLPSGMARATATTGLHGVSRVLFFLEEAAEGLLPVLPGLAPALSAGESSGGAGNSSPLDHHIRANSQANGE